MKTRQLMTLIVFIALAFIPAACGGGGAGGATPTATVKAYSEAAKKKDVQGIKNTMSKGSLELIGDFAKMGNKSLDEELKEMKTTAENLEVRNEVITGETASVEVKDEKGSWQKLPLVKENGQWKIAFDKAFADAFSAGQPGGGTGDKSGAPGSETGGANDSGGSSNSNQEEQK
jgi:hypothetical protein